MNKLRVFILCGLVGSGKSTWANLQVQKDLNLLVINKDGIRKMLYGGYEYRASSEGIIRVIADIICRLCLSRGTSVIIDETNLIREKRDNYLKIAREFQAEAILVVFPEKENNLANRMNSDSRGYEESKWARVIEVMKKAWEDVIPEEAEQYDITGIVDRETQSFGGTL
jgi:predicted kinase